MNRLIQVSQTGLTTQTYGYDGQGERISKTIGANTNYYLYNGMHILEEYANTLTSTPTQYTHGPRLDEIAIKQTATESQYYHQDGLNSLVAITNATGTTDATQRFNAWGEINASTGEAQYFGYTGREQDETGLIYYRARYYDKNLARFTKQDPLGMRGGLNYYAYVFNNPINFNDPTGLRPGDIYAVGPAPYEKVSIRDYAADRVNLAAQNMFFDNSRYVHMATEILPDINGNRRIAEATPDGVKIVDYNVWIKKELNDGRVVDEYNPLVEPSNESLVFLTLFATVFDGSSYDWSAYYGDIDTSNGEFICSEFCNAALLFSGLNGIDSSFVFI